MKFLFSLRYVHLQTPSHQRSFLVYRCPCSLRIFQFTALLLVLLPYLYKCYNLKVYEYLSTVRCHYIYLRFIYRIHVRNSKRYTSYVTIIYRWCIYKLLFSNKLRTSNLYLELVCSMCACINYFMKYFAFINF